MTACHGLTATKSAIEWIMGIYFFLTDINSTFTGIKNKMELKKSVIQEDLIKEVIFYGGCGKLVSE